MKLIQIINGTYGFRPSPFVVEPKKASDPPFEVNDEEAERLVNLGVAKVVDEVVPEKETKEDAPEADVEAPEEVRGAEPEDEPDVKEDQALESKTNDELSSIADGLGIEIPKRAKKADIIAAIRGAEEDDDEMPDLSAADPE